jgi:DNA-nicking Smr family endonuclease
MTADDNKPRRRKLSEEDHALWHKVTRSVAPLKRRSARSDPEAAPTPRKISAAAPARAATLPVRPTPTTPKKSAPPLVPLDRRSKQRLARGTQAIDARLDLHGQTQERAHATLLRFLRDAQANGAATVLVITGKGTMGDPAGERGVLRRLVPHWLALPQFRAYVVAVEDSHVRHGGSGSLYIRVRRSRNPE